MQSNHILSTHCPVYSGNEHDNTTTHCSKNLQREGGRWNKSHTKKTSSCFKQIGHLLLLLLLMGSNAAWATDYVLFSNGHFMGVSGGALSAPVTFDSSSCVWTTTALLGGSGTLSTTVNGTTYYLVNTGGTLSVSTTAGNATAFTLSADGRQWRTPNGYLQYNATAWDATGVAADNGYQLKGYYSFFWYRVYSGNTLNGYLFLSTSTDNYATGQPYMKGQTTEVIWAMLQYDATYSLLLNTNTGQFMIANNTGNNASNAVHLETPASLGTSAWFSFPYNSSNHYFNICPYGSSQSLNCFSNNQNNIGLYSSTDDGSRWHIIDQSLDAPSATTDCDGTTTLACPVANATFYYTTDGTRPTYQTKTNPQTGHTTYEYSSPIVIPDGTTPFNAVYADPATHYVSRMLAQSIAIVDKPVVIIEDDGQTTITSLVGADIYYTLDGTTPTAASTQYTAPFTMTLGQTVKVTAKRDAIYSCIVTITYSSAKPATPVVNFSQNGDKTGKVTITTSTADAIIFYTTNGSAPTVASNIYTGNFNVSHRTTVKAVAVKEGRQSEIGQNTYYEKLDRPTVGIAEDGTVTMSHTKSGVTIYYTIDGATPTTSSTAYSTPFVVTTDHTTVKAIAFYESQQYIQSDMQSAVFNMAKLTLPTIALNSQGNVTISHPNVGTTIYYTTDGSTPTTESSVYTTPFAPPVGIAVKAIVVKSNYYNSDVASATFSTREISSLDEIDDMSGSYRFSDDFTATTTLTGTFTGEIEGAYHTISGLSQPLFEHLSGAIIRNIVLDDVNLTASLTVNDITCLGAIAAYADGDTRIYNCGILSTNASSISGSGYVGGIVGYMDGTARVINCFSYATVSGGTWGAGIVGYNNVASTTTNLKTMVMNCMFYGNVASGTNIAPVYGGQIIYNNSNTGLNNFNYYSFEDFESTITAYNCALGAEKRFLERFEFYRQLLNSNRELAAWYATGSTANARNIMAKWVLDKSIAPYPILRSQGKYPSIINYDASAGTSLGTLGVTINESNTTSGGQTKPSGANVTTTSLTLIRTDKDPDNYNYNYDKVQLPYYNDIGTGNYTGNRVVTGWKITAITGGTASTFTTGTDVTVDGSGNVTATPYNFADRNCTQKDLYSVTGRIVPQGAYFDVPYGVTAITIEPYWAVAAYLSDPYYDKTYNASYSPYDITVMGARHTNGNSYNINGSSQQVYTTMGNAINALNRPDNSKVYDYAVVLVGNYHHYYGNSSIADDTKGFTIMSADLDFDNEPDNCLIYQHGNDRRNVSPIRFDFLCWPGIGMAQKPSDSQRMPGIGIFYPRGWFEITNTCITRFTEFEYDFNNKTSDSPLILQGGVYEQIVSTQSANPTHTSYIHLGGNAWFKMFNNGIHSNGSNFTPHRPISITGGEYDEFYLSGMFKPSATSNADNAECYISGGHFGQVAGAGQEQIQGDIYWQIYNADIDDFYGGGINAAKPVTGNITTVIYNSNVGVFCGGPKFGDMTTGKTVTTIADGSRFGTFFGAGYGGSSFNRVNTRDETNNLNYNFSNWVNSDYSRQYNSGNGGIAVNYEYELFAYAGFGANTNVARVYINYASLSLATTHNVISTLTGCTITGNFYGGGNMGKVQGDVTSTLTDCTVGGNIYGGGFSAAAPSLEVLPKAGFVKEPTYDDKSGAYIHGVFPTSVTYTWKQTASALTNGQQPFEDTGDDHFILTTVDMTTLGAVIGTVRLTIEGASNVGTVGNTMTGNVFGGGEESTVDGNTQVLLKGTTNVQGNVFGGGDKGAVSGNTSVQLCDDCSL